MKKLLVTLFIAMLACLLAFSVSAANEVTLTDGTQADFTTVFKVNDKNEVKGFNSGYDKNSVTHITFPDEIVGIEANGLLGSSTSVKTITFAATDTFFISGDNIFSKCSVETVTFNPDCIVELRKGNFSECKSLTQITFPKFSKLAGSAFKSCSNMVATNQLVFAEGMTEIGGHAFNGCTSLTGTVVFPSTLEKIQEYSFQNTGFSGFDLSKCSKLSLVGGGYGGPFNDNDNLVSIDMSACVSLTAISKGNLFAGCDNLEKVILPPNLTNLPEKAFSACPKLQSLVLPASCTDIGVEAFQYARKNQENQVFTLYIQSDVVFNTSKYSVFNLSSAKVEFILIGDGVTAESFKAANDYTHVTNAAVVDYLDPGSPWTYTVGGTLTTHTIVENYCTSLALTGKHLSKDNPCVICCTDCGMAAPKENPRHSESVFITYENGYANVGAKLVACTNEGCGHSVETEAKALFVCLGYSASTFGGKAIDIGYTVNNEAIDEYTIASKKTLEYGVFAASKNKLDGKDIFADDGTIAEGVISANLSNQQFDAFSVKITGITDDKVDVSLALGAYVAVTDGEGTKYSYIQTKSPSEGEKYYFASYSEIIG